MRRVIAAATIAGGLVFGGAHAQPPGPLSTIRQFAADDDVSPNRIDETIAAGPATLILANNGGVTIRGKSGASLQHASLATFFGPVRQASQSPFDVRVLYDEHSGRFFVLAAGRDVATAHLYLAVSRNQSPDTLTSADWHLLVLDARLENGERREQWADFPSMGVSEAALILTAQMFPLDGPASADTKVLRISFLEKGPLLQGVLPSSLDWVDVRDPQSGELLRAALQPVHHYGRGRATFIVGGSPAACGFVIFGIAHESPPSLSSRFVSTPNGSCRQAPDAPQPDGGTRLSVNGGLRVPAVYRDGSLWIAEAVGRTFDGGDVSAIRVTELNVDHWPDRPTVTQQMFLATAGTWRYYPSLVVDPDNNVGVIFGQSGPSEMASLYVTGRLASDPLNALRPPIRIRRGEAVMTLPTNPSRGAASFGDYFGAALDPVNGTMWVLGEYASTVTAFRRHAGEFTIR